MRALRGVRVWDLPTRMFHWLLVGLFLFSWWSAKSHHMDWHLLSGSTLVGLLVFRLIWGFIGGSTARFRSFLCAPGAVLGYLRGTLKDRPGHNPLGGYSVLALLALLASQVGTGLLATDTDGLESGPLSYLINFDHSRVAAKVHALSFNVLLVLVGFHVAAILYYLLVRRRDLVTPMITGSDDAHTNRADELAPAGTWRFLLAAAVSIGVAWWLIKLAEY
jgi:cytochrome b